MGRREGKTGGGAIAVEERAGHVCKSAAVSVCESELVAFECLKAGEGGGDGYYDL